MYSTQVDALRILEWLNKRIDIAFLLRTNPSCWQASWELQGLPEGPILLWHVPSGPLPLYPPGSNEVFDDIQDPFAGWKGRAHGAYPEMPHFAYSPKVFYWYLRVQSRFSWIDFSPIGPNTNGTIGRSYFFWWADHLKLIGKPSNPETRKCWAALRAFVRKKAIKVKAAESLNYADVLALPDAFQAIQQGTPRAPSFDPPKPTSSSPYPNLRRVTIDSLH